MRRLLRVQLACVAGLVLGCGGGGLHGRTYADDEAAYVLGPPGAQWRELRVADANDVAFAGPDGSIVQVNASCDPALDIPLAALTNHLLIGFTERDIHTQRLLPLDGREALETHVTAKLDGVSRELLITVLKKDGCVYDLALVANPGSPFEAARPTYDGLIAGFHAAEGAR